MLKATIQMEIDDDGAHLLLLQNGLPVMDWNGDINQIGLGFLELVMLLQVAQ